MPLWSYIFHLNPFLIDSNEILKSQNSTTLNQQSGYVYDLLIGYSRKTLKNRRIPHLFTAKLYVERTHKSSIPFASKKLREKCLNVL